MASGLSLPTVAEIRQSKFYELATANWLQSHTQPSDSATQVISNLFSLLQQDEFSVRSIAVLDYLQWLEMFLWPNWTTDSSEDHTVLIAIATVFKKRDNILDWEIFTTNETKCSTFFEKLLSLSLASKDFHIRSSLISFIACGFQSLDSAIVRRQVAPLVSILIWSSLHSNSVRTTLIEAASVQRPWRLANKRFDSANESKKSRLQLERTWLYSVLLELIQLLYVKSNDTNAAAIAYIEHVLELLIGIISQLPTRRFSNALLKDMNVIVAVKMSPVYKNEQNNLVRELLEIVDHYLNFPIDDITGVVTSPEDLAVIKSKQVLHLQKIALDHFRDKLLILALSNYGAVSKRDDLLENLDSLSDEELKQLCDYIGLATEYQAEGIPSDRQFMIELLAYRFVKRPSTQSMTGTFTSLPTDQTLMCPLLQQASAFDSSRPLAIPQFGLQYLSVGDFTLRAFELYRQESFFEIKNDLEAIVSRLKPQPTVLELKLAGTSRMAQKITKPAILETAPALVGETRPAFVRAEIYLELDKVAPEIQKEWEALRPGEVVFLIAIQAPNSRSSIAFERMGIKHVRAAEVVTMLDHNNSPIHSSGTVPKARGRPLYGKLARRRRLHVNIDPVAFAQDSDKVYDSVNVIVRRRPRENNFKPVLDTLKELTLSEVTLPDWLVDVFLGYGDPESVSYENLSVRPETIDMNDTFVSWGHIESSFEKVVTVGDNVMVPPFVIHETPDKTFEVSTYSQPSLGPHVTDARPRNTIQFTPKQVQAIYSGTNPGLTVIVGPPGTGKTDVLAQIISNINHAQSDQRTLVVANSTHALTKLFEKLGSLDVAERHLLRLGHGEDDNDTYTGFGRVESLMNRRAELLRYVAKLGNSVGAVGTHGESCESAGYFYSVFVQPTWDKYLNARKSVQEVAVLASLFPFHSYFADAPQPLFNPDTHTIEEATEIADSCFRHLQNVFTELAEMRPFELLRSSKAQIEYMLTSQARVVAMTATYAAMKRNEIVSLGFRYQNVIVAEAAQLSEIESFVPLTLQVTSESAGPIERVILAGDHLQNGPIVANVAFRKYGNMDQSLFARLLRSQVPSIMLDAQARTRPEIADLYRWRYSSAGIDIRDLALCSESDEYKFANAGFKHVMQFISVDDYNGQGESEPAPHFLQNLGEAEYAVAIFMYMRLLGYAADKITLLTTYSGQKALLLNVLAERCSKIPIFGMPTVATVDQYQGRSNDYVILSLVRTDRIGYLRDQRRLTTAFSRSRLGLYVLGRRELLESSPETAAFLNRFKPTVADRLELSIGEMFPSSRLADEVDDAKVAVMQGVEHLGSFVFEMTNQKLERMRADGALPALIPVAAVSDDQQDSDEDSDDEEMEDEYSDDDENVDESMDDE
ncbi:P-loop containing nucleoside triphosphate hydrolase protein [Lipomyces arxii]|uniref:P-loop containing nucleoside triphosphate hydrolase protein n=1 Tax=Lipomyces arxii TaxID=56418 RepID=UPI0034CDD008